MRIIRFVTDDGSVRCGIDRGDGSANVVRDTAGVLAGQAAPSPKAMLKGMRAIVADDDANMRQLVVAVLEKAGCACTSCTDGLEAMNAIQHEAVDLVVSDIMMPHHNGYEIFSAARERDEHLPIVLITGFGYDPNHSLVRASADGLHTVLYKPFTPQQLMEELVKAIIDVEVVELTGESATIRTLLSPLEPVNIICIGRNYPPFTATAGDDGSELEVFMKPTTALQATGEPIRIPRFEGDDDIALDGEGELGVVIGRMARDVTPDRALEHVLGYTIANDVTARRWQTPSGPPAWMRGKGFDTFCPIGPALVTADAVPNPDDLEITTTINGTITRQGSTADMVRSVPEIITQLSSRVTLEPGTLVLTGGPGSLRPDERISLQPGDEIAVEISGLGRLVNSVV
ncbi:MAG: fumarylacetoacetate hydrolase family protein [Planctomycetota bacterium]|jgi:2-keto-4-pentenoate hydratase/2-oxohepta-3-ene-1,7-dioic acid hydratase in catechol pathway